MTDTIHPYYPLELAERKFKEKPTGSVLMSTDYVSKRTNEKTKMYWIFPSYEFYLIFIKDDTTIYELIQQK